jgi:WXXGXW repeat (2 copies)
MRRLMLASLLGLTTVAGCGPPAVVVRPEPVYVAQPAPPELLVEERPPQPAPNVFWVGGHWQWVGNRYNWHPGHWEQQRAYEQWVGPHWQARNGQWVFEPGHWRRVGGQPVVVVQNAPPPQVVVEQAPPQQQVVVEQAPPQQQVVVEQAPPQEVVVVEQAPPPPRVEVIPARPYANAFWIGGFWRWQGGRHVWVNGHYEAARPGMRWQPHRWEQFNGRWRFVPGRWGR